MATIWIITHEPKSLKVWLEKHPPGDVLETIARKWIASGSGRVYGEGGNG